MYTKLFLRCFNSGSFSYITSQCLARSGFLLQFKSHITDSIVYNSNFQYTQDKLSALDNCLEKEEILFL